jgi:phosphoribosylcarboxyaminoimidazole (NCAIR) mutase
LWAVAVVPAQLDNRAQAVAVAPAARALQELPVFRVPAAWEIYGQLAELYSQVTMPAAVAVAPATRVV